MDRILVEPCLGTKAQHPSSKVVWYSLNVLKSLLYFLGNRLHWCVWADIKFCCFSTPLPCWAVSNSCSCLIFSCVVWEVHTPTYDSSCDLQRFGPEALEFQEKIIERAGLGDETYLPQGELYRPMHTIAHTKGPSQLGDFISRCAMEYARWQA